MVTGISGEFYCRKCGKELQLINGAKGCIDECE